MNKLHEINEEIKNLESKLGRVKGRATEVYSRIVGYYRSVGNWNEGKRAEFGERRTFDVPEQPIEVGPRVRATAKEAILSA